MEFFNDSERTPTKMVRIKKRVKYVKNLRHKTKNSSLKKIPRILAVEDESIIALDLKMTLERFGYEVCGVTAYGEEAVQLATFTKPDVIFMDIKLRGRMNGMTAAKKITNHLKIPIVYLTAYGDEATLKDFSLLDKASFIMKPFDEEEIQVAIRRALALES